MLYYIYSDSTPTGNGSGLTDNNLCSVKQIKFIISNEDFDVSLVDQVCKIHR